MKPILALSVALLVLAALAAPSAGAATFALTVKADASSYSGAQPLIASGAVSPPPGSGTAVFLKIIGPSGGSPLTVGSASVNESTGAYQHRFVLGGSSSWVAGTYTLAASWGNSLSSTVNATTTFAYTPTTTTTTTSTSTTTSTTSTTQTLPPGAHIVILNGASSNLDSPGFSPATITVVIGVNNTVTWINNDTAIHTATATDSSFNSGDIASHAIWSHTFTTAGTFSYMCVYHGWMKGTVIVKVAGGTTSTTTSTAPTTSTTTTTSTSITTTTTTSTTTTSNTVTTPSTTTSSLTSSSGGGIPEFPFQLLGASGLTALVVASYLLARRRQISGGLVGQSSA